MLGAGSERQRVLAQNKKLVHHSEAEALSLLSSSAPQCSFNPPTSHWSCRCRNHEVALGLGHLLPIPVPLMREEP